MTVLVLLMSCVPDFHPDRGEWVADPVTWADPCAAGLFPERPWRIDDPDGAFVFALPGTADPVCTRAEREYTCEIASGEAFTAAHEGAFTGRSEAEVTVHLQADACDTTGTTTARSSWRHVRDDPEATGFNIFRDWELFGYDPPPVDGQCTADWEDLPGCEESDGTRATVVFENRASVPFSLFEGDILAQVIPTGTSSFDLCVDGVYAVVEEGVCETVFIVPADGRTVVVGEDEPPPTDTDTDVQTFDQLCSVEEDAILREVTFENGSGQAADLYYIGADCVPLPAELLAPGAQSVRPFYTGEVWRLRAFDTTWLDEVRLQASDDGTVVVLGD